MSWIIDFQKNVAFYSHSSYFFKLPDVEYLLLHLYETLSEDLNE